MNNEMIDARELPTLDFIMSEVRERKAPEAQTAMPGNRMIGILFYLLAPLQILTIFGGAVLGLFIAPASLFASRTEADEVFAVAVGLVGITAIALGVVLIPLALVAGMAFAAVKKWRNMIGIGAAGLAILEFPFGTVLGCYLVWKIFKQKKPNNTNE